MAVISIQFNDMEYKLIRQHIENKGVSASQYIKNVLLEKIEEEHDVSLAYEYMKEKKALEMIPFDEAAKEWDFDA